MKKLLLLFMLCLPLVGMAKDKKDNNNPKYLAGAVTMADGKVTFKKELRVSGADKHTIFVKLKDWAENRFKADEKMQGRTVYANEDEGVVAVMGEEYMVFSSSAFSLDRTRIYYQLVMNVSDGLCQLSMSRIRYWYDEARDGGEKYTAEEWITDKMALNKSQTKLLPICGKFRRKTIDLKDELFASATTALDVKVDWMNADARPVAVVPTVVELNAKGKLKAVEVAQLPANLAEVAEKGRLTLTSADGEEIEVKSESWAGVEKLDGKDVVRLLIDKSRIAANALLEQSESYKVSFYVKGSTNAVVIIECKKLGKEETTTEQLTAKGLKFDSSKQYVIYTGEITKVSMR